MIESLGTYEVKNTFSIQLIDDDLMWASFKVMSTVTLVVRKAVFSGIEKNLIIQTG